MLGLEKGRLESKGTAGRGGDGMGQRESEVSGTGEGAADAPHLGPGEGPEESGRDAGGAGGLTITEQLLLSLRPSGWPSALSPTLSSGCKARTWGRSQNRAQPLHFCPPPASPQSPPPQPDLSILSSMQTSSLPPPLPSSHPNPTLKPVLMVASHSNLEGGC